MRYIFIIYVLILLVYNSTLTNKNIWNRVSSQIFYEKFCENHNFFFK